MYFENQDENKNLTDRLRQVVAENSVSHAYIFEGSNCLDKKRFAESFIKGILCPENLGENCGKCSICSKIDHDNHEDIIYISSSEKTIKDEDIIGMQERIKIKPFGDRNIVIIQNSDTLTLRAQNRLLKTLEEPPGKSIIILLCENMENLVQTIQSRCVKYRINYFGAGNYDHMMSKAQEIIEMIFNRESFYKLKQDIEDIAKDQEETASFLDSMQLVYRQMLLKKSKDILLYKDEDIIKNIHAVEAARKQIRQGVSPAYGMKNLLLKIGG